LVGTRQKIPNFDGLGFKIAVLYFTALSPTSLSAIGDSVKKMKTLSATAVKIQSSESEFNQHMDTSFGV
jgi:hypothetical protein